MNTDVFTLRKCWPLLFSGTRVAGRPACVGRCPVEGDVAGALELKRGCGVFFACQCLPAAGTGYLLGSGNG